MPKRSTGRLDKFPDLTAERCGELALLCLRRCTHYHGRKHRDYDLDVTDEDLEDCVRNLFKDYWANINLKKGLSSYDTALYVKFDFHGAIGLRSADADELADPYIRIVYGGVVYLSKVKYATLSPCWNEEILIGPVKPDDKICIELWDSDPSSFSGQVSHYKNVRSLRGLAIYLRELFKFGDGDDYLGGAQVRLRELLTVPTLFRKDVIRDEERCGEISFSAEFQCAEKDLPQMYHSHYYLCLHLLLKETPTLEHVCLKQILSPANRALLRRQATGLSVQLRTICQLQAVHKAIVKHSLPINAVVAYDLTLSLLGHDLTDFEELELQHTSTAYTRLIERKWLVAQTFAPRTPSRRMHLMGALSLCATFQKLGYPDALDVAETALNAYIFSLGQAKPVDLGRKSEPRVRLAELLNNLNAMIVRLRSLNELVIMSWSRELAEVAYESLEAFAISSRQEIGNLANPEDALKVFEVLKNFCEDFRIPTNVLSRCFSDEIVRVWLERLENEAPYWSRFVVKQDVLFGRTVGQPTGQLLSKSCEDFLSRLHHSLSGIYSMTSCSLELSEVYARTLCQCGFQYIKQLAAAAEKQKLLSRTGYSSGFNRRGLVVLNNMASTYTLLVTDLEELVETRDESERRQWKHLSSAGEDVFNHWSPRPILTQIRKVFETTAEAVSSAIADDTSDVLVTVCESPTEEILYERLANFDKLLGSQLETLQTLTFASVYRILIGRAYELVMDNTADILTNLNLIKPDERALFGLALAECCKVMEAAFLDPEHALPHHRVKTPRQAWILHTSQKMAQSQRSVSPGSGPRPVSV